MMPRSPTLPNADLIGWLTGREGSQFTVEADAMRCYELWKDPTSLVTIFDLITCVDLLRLMPPAPFGDAIPSPSPGELRAGEGTGGRRDYTELTEEDGPEMAGMTWYYKMGTYPKLELKTQWKRVEDEPVSRARPLPPFAAVIMMRTARRTLNRRPTWDGESFAQPWLVRPKARAIQSTVAILFGCDGQALVTHREMCCR